MDVAELLAPLRVLGDLWRHRVAGLIERDWSLRKSDVSSGELAVLGHVKIHLIINHRAEPLLVHREILHCLIAVLNRWSNRVLSVILRG